MRPFFVALVTLSASCLLGQKPPKGHWNAQARQMCAGQVCYIVGALPPSWRLVEQRGGAIGFFSDEAGAVIESNVTCGSQDEAAPLAALTNQLLIGYTERRVRAQALVPLAGREALHSLVDAKLDGVPTRLDLYVLKRNGCVFDLSFAVPANRQGRGERDFAEFVAGFQQTRGA
jgi:hypothetical protein